MEQKKFWSTVWDLMKIGFAVTGSIWTVLEILERYFPDWEFVDYGRSHIRVMIIPAVVVVAGMCVRLLYQESIITFVIKGVKVKIQARDILHKKKGLTVVGVNRQLNTKQEQIGETSIHRAMLDRYGQEKLDRAFKNGERTGWGWETVLSGKTGGPGVPVFVYV